MVPGQRLLHKCEKWVKVGKALLAELEREEEDRRQKEEDRRQKEEDKLGIKVKLEKEVCENGIEIIKYTFS